MTKNADDLHTFGLETGWMKCAICYGEKTCIITNYSTGEKEQITCRNCHGTGWVKGAYAPGYAPYPISKYSEPPYEL